MSETDRLRLLAEARQRRANAAAPTAQQEAPFDPMVPRADPPGYVAPPRQDNSGFLGRTRDMGADGFEQAGRFLSSMPTPFKALHGQIQPSPTAQAIPESVPLFRNDGVQVPIPGPVREVAGRLGDVAMVPLSAMSGIASGGAGLVGDTADALGMAPNRADMLARDIAAVPEAFAGSPTAFGPMTRVEGAPARQMRPAPSPTDTPEGVGLMVRNAASNERTNGATRKAAQSMNINTDAMASAERLGMELPADVMSDNGLVREAAGLTRSVAGSEPSVQFRDAVRRASVKAEEAMQTLGGSDDISLASANVRTALETSRTDLETQSQRLYNAVDSAVPKGTRIEPNNMVNAVNEVAQELGGTDGFTTAERNLFNLVTGDQPITYERLMREKRLVGRAIARGDGPYGDADQAALSRVYGAMVEDQLSNVERVGGAELRANLEAANRLHGQKKDLESEIIAAFGRDQAGSIATTLRQAVTQGAQGNISQLNRVMSVVPSELRAEALATAITSVSLSNRAGAPGFDFAKFAKTHDGLSRNTQVYDRVRTILGPQATQTMSDLAEVSRRVTEARGNVLTTGKANQALVNSMTAENVISRVMDTSVGRGVTRSVASGAGAAAGGPVGMAGGAQIGENLIKALSRGEAARIAAAGRLFSSPEFQRLAVEAATTGRASQETMDAVSSSSAFRNWARQTGVASPQAWIAATVLASQQDERSDQDQQPQ